MTRSYELNSRALLLKDSPQNIDFHIRTGDYFSFLATLLGFIEESLAGGEKVADAARKRALVHELRNDLRFVQANYRIVRRDLGDVQVVPPTGNLLERAS